MYKGCYLWKERERKNIDVDKLGKKKSQIKF